MVNWILVVVLAALAIFIIMKLKTITDKKQNITYKLLLILVAALFISGVFVWFKARPDLTTYQGFLSLGKAYYSWVASLFGNMGSITGYAVQQDWGVQNLTSALP